MPDCSPTKAQNTSYPSYFGLLSAVLTLLVALSLSACQVSEPAPLQPLASDPEAQISKAPQAIEALWLADSFFVSWQDVANNENYYELSLRNQAGAWSNSRYTEANITSLEFTEIPYGDVAQVRLRSGNSYGESAWQLIDLTRVEPTDNHLKPSIGSGATTQAPARLLLPALGTEVVAGKPLMLNYSLAPEIWLDIGTEPQGHNLLSMAVSGGDYETAPIQNGIDVLHITLWSLVSGQWQFQEYAFDVVDLQQPVNESTPAPDAIVFDDRPVFNRTPGIVSYRPLNQTAEAGVQLYAGRSDGQGVDLVVVAEGYTQIELDKFVTDAKKLVDTAFDFHPLDKHLPAWNIHFLALPSAQSGADGSADKLTDVNTRYDARYYCSGIERLLCVNERAVRQDVARYVPQYDEILVLVNAKKYGGAGYQSMATASLASAAVNLVRHEMGHSFAGLADEYDYGNSSAPHTEPAAANATLVADPSKVKWRHWLANPSDVHLNEGNGIGLWEGAVYAANGVYRPSKNSMMFSLGQAFGEVNSEAWALAVYQTVSPILSSLPKQGALKITQDAKQWFALDGLYAPEAMKVTWRLDGEIVSPESAREAYYYLFSAEQTGRFELTATVTDGSGIIRRDLMTTTQTLSWVIDVE